MEKKQDKFSGKFVQTHCGGEEQQSEWFISMMDKEKITIWSGLFPVRGSEEEQKKKRPSHKYTQTTFLWTVRLLGLNVLLSSRQLLVSVFPALTVGKLITNRSVRSGTKALTLISNMFAYVFTLNLGLNGDNGVRAWFFHYRYFTWLQTAEVGVERSLIFLCYNSLTGCDRQNWVPKGEYSSSHI